MAFATLGSSAARPTMGRCEASKSSLAIYQRSICARGYFTSASAFAPAGVARTRRCRPLRLTAAAEHALGDPSSGDIPVTLHVKQHVKFGEVLKIVGEVPALGGWRLDNAPALSWSDGDSWHLDLELPAGKHEYKLVIHNPEEDAAYWELGDNRVIHVQEGAVEFVLEFNGGEFVAEPIELEAPAAELAAVEEVAPPASAAEELTPETPAPVEAEPEPEPEPVVEIPTTPPTTPDSPVTATAPPADEVEEKLPKDPIVAVVEAPAPVVVEEETPAVPAVETKAAKAEVTSSVPPPPPTLSAKEEAKHAAVEPAAEAFNVATSPTTEAQEAEEATATAAAGATLTSAPTAEAKGTASKPEALGQRTPGLKKKGGKRGARATKSK